jgi:hypothetical protein
MTLNRNRFPAIVAKVLSSDRVVINRGTRDGVAVGQRFVLYSLDPDVIVDPSTGVELGRLEIPKGDGGVSSVQEEMAIVFNEVGYFSDPKVGDLAKPI